MIDAEHEDQRHFGDEEQPEEEGESAQRLVAPPLEGDVVDLIDERAQRIEKRRCENARDDGVDAEARVDDVGDVGAEDDESGVRDVDDVEHAEGDRHADRHGGVEAAKENPGDDRAQQQIEGNHARSFTLLRGRSPRPANAPTFFTPHGCLASLIEPGRLCRDASLAEERWLGESMDLARRRSASPSPALRERGDARVFLSRPIPPPTYDSSAISSSGRPLM
jgi:hypothetical protein